VPDSAPLHPLRLFLLVAAVFLLFHASAAAFGSDRGQYGLLVAGIVTGATIAIESRLTGRRPREAARLLGLGRPQRRGMVAAGVVCALLLLIFAALRLLGVAITPLPGGAGLVYGLLAQAGVAEELLFRGFLFGHLRHGRTFGRAVLLSLPPFAAVHTLLFFTMPWPVALAAIGLSLVMSLPLSQLYELGGRTIWAPALLHAVAQGAIKLVVIPESAAVWLPVLWMAAAAVVPMLVFLFPRDP
jgi:membrane protease YdiL (CAAX protease family)